MSLYKNRKKLEEQQIQMQSYKQSIRSNNRGLQPQQLQKSYDEFSSVVNLHNISHHSRGCSDISFNGSQIIQNNSFTFDKEIKQNVNGSTERFHQLLQFMKTRQQIQHKDQLKNILNEQQNIMFDNKDDFKSYIDYEKQKKRKSQQMYEKIYKNQLKNQSKFLKKQSIYIDEKKQLPQSDKTQAFSKKQSQKQKDRPLFPSAYDYDALLDGNKDQRIDIQQAMQFVNVVKGFKQQIKPKNNKNKQKIELGIIRQQRDMQQSKYDNLIKNYQHLQGNFRQLIDEMKKSKSFELNNEENNIIDNHIDSSISILCSIQSQSSQFTRNSKNWKKNNKQQQKSQIFSRINQKISNLQNAVNNTKQSIQKQKSVSPRKYTKHQKSDKSHQITYRNNFSGNSSKIDIGSCNRTFEIPTKSQSVMLSKAFEQQKTQRYIKLNDNISNKSVSIKPSSQFEKFEKHPSIKTLSRNSDQQNQIKSNHNHKISNQQTTIFDNNQFLITTTFARTYDTNHPLQVKFKLYNKCQYPLKQLNISVRIENNYHKQPKQIYFDEVQKKDGCQFEVWLNRQILHNKFFQIQLSYYKLGIKRKINAKVPIPSTYQIQAINITQYEFCKKWFKIKRQNYIPPRNLPISQMNWHNYINQIFPLINEQNILNQIVENDHNLCSYGLVFYYSQFKFLMFLKIQCKFHGKVSLRFKTQQQIQNSLQEQILNLINNLLFENF